MPTRHAWIVRNAPVRFTSMSSCHCSTVMRWPGAIVVVTPALATHTSISPSAGNGSRAMSIAMSQPSRRSSVRTSMPSARRRSAIAAPMPRAAPVTSALAPAVTIVRERSSKEGTMTDRWFSDEQLEQLSRPTMDRAIEAIDAGDLDGARRLCAEMKHEWQMLHDLMAAGVLDLVSFIQQRLGEDGVAEAWEESMNRGWRRHHGAIDQLDRRDLVPLLAATWRAPSCPAGGPHPRGLSSRPDQENGTFSPNPSASPHPMVATPTYPRPP